MCMCVYVCVCVCMCVYVWEDGEGIKCQDAHPSTPHHTHTHTHSHTHTHTHTHTRTRTHTHTRTRTHTHTHTYTHTPHLWRRHGQGSFLEPGCCLLGFLGPGACLRSGCFCLQQPWLKAQGWRGGGKERQTCLVSPALDHPFSFVAGADVVVGTPPFFLALLWTGRITHRIMCTTLLPPPRLESPRSQEAEGRVHAPGDSLCSPTGLSHEGWLLLLVVYAP